TTSVAALGFRSWRKSWILEISSCASRRYRTFIDRTFSKARPSPHRLRNALDPRRTPCVGARPLSPVRQSSDKRRRLAPPYHSDRPPRFPAAAAATSAHDRGFL